MKLLKGKKGMTISILLILVLILLSGCAGEMCIRDRDRALLNELLKEFRPVLRTYTQGLFDFGTAGGVQGVEANGDLPIKNWTLGDWAEGAEKTCGQYMEEQGLSLIHI